MLGWGPEVRIGGEGGSIRHSRSVLKIKMQKEPALSRQEPLGKSII